MKLNPNPKALIVSERKMFAGQLEASCRLVYCSNGAEYELDLSIGNQDRRTIKGSLNECLNRGQMFVDNLLSQGFVCDMPITYQSSIN